MEALAGLYASSDDDADGSEGGAPSPPCKRARTEAAGRCFRNFLRRPTSVEGRAAWQHELQTHSLERLQRECALWPSAASATERKRRWEWLVGVCSSEFAPELAANRAAGDRPLHPASTAKNTSSARAAHPTSARFEQNWAPAGRQGRPGLALRLTGEG